MSSVNFERQSNKKERKDLSEPLKFLILPGSGENFPKQVAIVRDLCSSGYLPDVSMGASGGNLISYIAAAADWESCGITRLCRTLNSDLYCDSWFGTWLNFLPSWIMGLFKGSMYNSSDKYQQFFKLFFNKQTLQSHEIWTGVYNCNSGMSQLFCNRSADKCQLKYIGTYPHEKCLDPIYLNNDLKDIPDGCVASATIPGYIPWKKIDDCKYIDGALSHASPGGMMSRSLKKVKYFHITYISCINLDKKNKLEEPSNLLKMGLNTMVEVINILRLKDRTAVIDLLRGKYYYKEIKNCSISKMKKINSLMLKSKRSVVEYYPKKEIVIAITEYTGDDLIKIMDQCKEQCGARIWWVGKKKLLDGII